MQYVLAGHTNSYHTYSLDEALEGIAKAGFKYVELSAVEGWTEHVPLDATDEQIAEIQAKMDRLGLKPSTLSGHSDLTTEHGLAVGKKAVDLCVKLGLSLMNTAIGGHYSEDENKDAFMGNIHALADYAADRDVTIGLEVHGDIMASGEMSIPLIQEIGRPNVGINYDTANCVFYGDVQAVDDLRPVVPYLVQCPPEGQNRRQEGVELPGRRRRRGRFRSDLQDLGGRGLQGAAQRRDRVQRPALAAAGRGRPFHESLVRDPQKTGPVVAT